MKIQTHAIKYLIKQLAQTQHGRTILQQSLSGTGMLKRQMGASSVEVVTSVSCSGGTITYTTIELSVDECGRVTLGAEAEYEVDCCGSGSGGSGNLFMQFLDNSQITQSSHNNGKLKFIRNYNRTIGMFYHRSGWPFAFKELQKHLYVDQKIMLDDFVEQNFSYTHKKYQKEYNEPWIGIFHHPQNIPLELNFFKKRIHRPDQFMNTNVFKNSAKHLKLAICLSDYLAQYLSNEFHIPTTVVKLPGEITPTLWDDKAYFNSDKRKLIQIGWYIRNTMAIYQTPNINKLEKHRISTKNKNCIEYDEDVRLYWNKRNERKDYGKVIEHGYIKNQEYDKMLSTGVVITELFDSSANTLIVDCISRNTPIVVNKHPAVVEYLGESYPLYMESPEQIEELMQDHKIQETHNYMINMDKTWLDGEYFSDKIELAIEKSLIAQ